MSSTAVIIPYFQRERGKLAAAIRSVLNQENAGPITIVVCDDESPVPVDDELDLLATEERDRVILVRQKNAGPAAARNAAMDAMPTGINWIAFLDSDDRWSPDHIARSVAALQQGYDLCFADALREPEETTHFQNAGFVPSQHQPITTLQNLFALSEDFLTLNIRMSPVSISTVVMRADALGDLRFARMPFEDLMYWFEAARHGAKIAFDSSLQVHYSRGNITVTDHWISQASLRNTLCYHRIFMHVAREFSLTPEQRTILEQRIAANRLLFSRIALGFLYHAQWPNKRMIMDFLSLDPRGIRALLGTLATEMTRRLPFFRRYARNG